MKVLIAGASGLVGGELLKAFFLNPAFTEVVVLSRRSIPDLPAKARFVLTDLGPYWLKQIEFESFDAVFCALGTTIKKAKTKEAFRKVDEEAILRLARFAKSSGSKQFLLVSSIGANPRSQTFYLQIKGQVEKEVEKLSIPSVSILRPSIILGERKEYRPSEEIGKTVFQLFSPLMILWLKKYRGVEARTIAHAMVDLALKAKPGLQYVESDRITEIARGNLPS